MLGQRIRKKVERLSQCTCPTMVQQQQPARTSVLTVERNRGPAPTATQKAKMLVAMIDEATGDGRKRGASVRAAEKFADLVSPTYPTKLAKKIRDMDDDEEDPFARKQRSDTGVPKKLTPTKQKRMHELAIEWDGEFSSQDMADQINEEFGEGTITGQGISKHMRLVLPGDWELNCNVRAKPMLSEDHRNVRVGFVCEKLFDRLPQGTVKAHVDEKWFYTRKLHGRRKMPKGMQPRPLFVRHKSHVPKAMFLACTADNRHGGTGKIGIWRVAETV